MHREGYASCAALQGIVRYRPSASRRCSATFDRSAHSRCVGCPPQATGPRLVLRTLPGCPRGGVTPWLEAHERHLLFSWPDPSGDYRRLCPWALVRKRTTTRCNPALAAPQWPIISGRSVRTDDAFAARGMVSRRRSSQMATRRHNAGSKCEANSRLISKGRQ